MECFALPDTAPVWCHRWGSPYGRCDATRGFPVNIYTEWKLLSPLVRRLKEWPDAWKIWKYTMSVIVIVYFFAHFRSTVFRCKYCKDSHLYKKITFG